MGIKKIYDVEDCFISSKRDKSVNCNESYTLCGRTDEDEFRVLSKLDLNEINKLNKIENNIEKVELCMYLSDVKISNHMDKYMINIGINLRDFDINEVSYITAPKFYQECSMYVIKPEYKDQYIFFDITKITFLWLNKIYPNYGITLMGINESGLAIFKSYLGDKKTYIKVTYKEEVKEECFKNISTRSYGFFWNDTGRLNNSNCESIVIWNKGRNSKNISIGKTCTDLIVKEKGIYQIDYSINLRSNDLSYMMLIINNVCLEESMVQVGRQESASNGNVLVNICKVNSSVKLIIKTKNAILADIGLAASIRIIKI